MAEAPSGTVAFLFTDIEGSTRLLAELGERYAEVLVEHRRLLRAAFARHGGFEVDTEGDAFFVAFASAREGVAAAAEAQASLRVGPVRVRMGVHTGEAQLVEGTYVGMDVHRAARIAAAGNGGQVVLSDSTRALLDPALALRDLGEHRLKDLTAPERLWQLGVEQFPPLRSLNRTNLPVAASPLIGRARELQELLALVRDGQRVVTVTGPGGSGKTRLALQTAAEVVEEFAGGVFFVPFAPLRDGELVLSTIAQAVGARGDLAEHLKSAPTLLVLDNLEHLLEAAPTVAQLLSDAPPVKALVTSRAPLRVSGEYEYALDPLAEAEAVALFLVRARAVRRGVESDESVRAICRRLDRLPLALELAAARIKLLEPGALLERLERRLPMLTAGHRDAPRRQQTLRATIEWSYDLLEPEAQAVFCRLSVFAGSVSLEAAEQVADADLNSLAALVDLNLLKAMADSRLLMLETIREFAGEKLSESGDEQSFAQRHAEHYHALAEALRPFHSAELQRSFEHEQDNFRVALEHLITFGPSEYALEMVDSLCNYWILRGQLDEGERWTERALAAADTTPRARRAWAISGLGEFARFRGDDARAIPLKEEVLALSRDIGDVSLEAATLHDLADTHTHAGDYARARELAMEALELRRRAGRPTGIAHALSSLFDIELFEGHYEEAQRVAQEVAQIEGEHAPGSIEHSIALFALAEAHRRQGELHEAVGMLREALSLASNLNQRQNLCEMLFAAAALVAASDAHRAGVLIGAAEAIRKKSGFYLWDPDECERIIRSVREQLGDLAFEAAAVEGSALEGDAALAAAIDSVTSL
jgi:predicted ATPase/class 3 adenylate cyclase